MDPGGVTVNQLRSTKLGRRDMGCSCVISRSASNFRMKYNLFMTSVWESTLLLTLVCQLSAMQVSQLLHEALLCLHAVLFACKQTPDMPFMLPGPTS